MKKENLKKGNEIQKRIEALKEKQFLAKDNGIKVYFNFLTKNGNAEIDKFHKKSSSLIIDGLYSFSEKTVNYFNAQSEMLEIAYMAMIRAEIEDLEKQFDEL